MLALTLGIGLAAGSPPVSLLVLASALLAGHLPAPRVRENPTRVRPQGR